MRTATRLAALGAAALLASAEALSQGFPARPVRVVVPFPAGGTTDIIARLVAQRMSETLGQPAIVENRAGAGGSIGADAVAKAAPDGYTILMHNITFRSLRSRSRSPTGRPTTSRPTSQGSRSPRTCRW